MYLCGMFWNNLSFLIAQKILRSQTFTKLIVRIAVAAVALSVAVMILAIALIKGFKTEISAKVFGFWGHVHVTNIGTRTTACRLAHWSGSESCSTAPIE